MGYGRIDGLPHGFPLVGQGLIGGGVRPPANRTAPQCQINPGRLFQLFAQPEAANLTVDFCDSQRPE
jgi:hypothetical protein